ncbi:hypothetical protein GCM10022629_65730 [Amorphoplanes auranticolor]
MADLRLGGSPQIVPGDGYVGAGVDQLHRHRVAGQVDRGTQHVVPGHDDGHGRPERLGVERPVVVNLVHVHVVIVVVVAGEAFHQHSGLHLGQRVGVHDGLRQLLAIGRFQQRVRLDEGVGGGWPARPLGQRRGDGGDGPQLEDVPHGDVESRAAERTHQRDGPDGVTAQLEEPVVDTDPVAAQHFGPDSRHAFLERRPRSGLNTGRVRLTPRFWQRAVVQFAVGVQRNEGHGDDRRGHHVLRQAPGQHRTQVRRLRLGDDVRRELFVPGGGGPHEHPGVGDPGVGGEHRLDLAELDAVSPELHLAVAAAQELDVTVGQEPYAVTGPVEAPTAGAVRVGQEPLGGEPGPVRVAAGHAGAAHVQLARRTRRHRVEPVVQHVHRHARQWPPDRHDVVEGRRADRVCAGADRSLGGAVLVDQGGGGRELPPRLHEAPGECLAGDHEQRGEGAGLRLVQLLHEDLQVPRRHLDEGVRRRPGQLRAQRADVDVLADHVHRLARQQRCPDVGYHQVESDRPEERGAVDAGGGELLDRPGHVVGQAPVGHFDAFGSSGRTGGVDDVRQFVEMVRDREGGVRQCAQGVGIAVERDDRGRGGAEPVHVLGLGDHGGDTGVGDHRGDPVGRENRVHRQVGGAGLPRTGQGSDQVGAAVQQDGDHRLRPDAGGGQPVRDPGGPAVEVAVGADVVRTGGDRDRVGRPAHLLLEAPQDAVRHLSGGMGRPVPEQTFTLVGREQGGTAVALGVVDHRLQGGAVHRRDTLGHFPPQPPGVRGQEDVPVA